MRNTSVRLAGALLAGTLLVAGCSGETPDTDDGGGGLSVVASTDVYGSIMEQVGGDHVSVQSLINRPSQDPHSYEATARDRLAVSDAELVVLNGGGYDSFMEKLTADEGIDSADILNAVDISGLEEAGSGSSSDHADEEGHDDGHGHSHSHGGFNEHVWYSLDAMGLLAEAAAERLAELDPDNASTFRGNAAGFNEGLERLEGELAVIRQSAGGRDIALTEPVPEYLFEEAGLHNITPDDFTESVEEGADVPPVVLKEMQDLLKSGEVAFLAYNSQTATAQTEAVRSTADEAGVPVLDFSETLPEGLDYLGWMEQNIAAMEGVLK